MHVLPDVDSAEILAIPNGTEIYVDYVYNDWGHVSYSGAQGWIYLGYVRFN